MFERTYEKALKLQYGVMAYRASLHNVVWPVSDPRQAQPMLAVLNRIQIDTTAWSDARLLRGQLRQAWVNWEDDDYQRNLAELGDAEARLDEERQRLTDEFAAVTEKMAEVVGEVDEYVGERLWDIVAKLRNHPDGVSWFAPHVVAAELVATVE